MISGVYRQIQAGSLFHCPSIGRFKPSHRILGYGLGKFSNYRDMGRLILGMGDRLGTASLSVANSYSRCDREFEKAAAMLFPSEVAQRGRMRDHTAAPFRRRVTV